MKLIEGEVVMPHEQASYDSDLRQARAERDRAVAVVTTLRKQLAPLYHALQKVFADTESVQASGGVDERELTVWNRWKEKLPPGCGKIIDALLTHGRPMNTTQLSIATGLRRASIPNLIVMLKKAGLITKENGSFTLTKL